MSEHAPLAPSAAERWVNCPGSVQMCLQFPEPAEETEQQREGTAAHWAMAEALAGRVIADGQIAPNGHVLDDEMVDAAEEIAEMLAPYPVRHVEQRLPAGRRVHPQCWGTPDVWFFDGILRLYDFKYGRGVVEHYENWQLICYVALLLDLLGVDGYSDQSLQVETTIIQPRVYHREGRVRTWRFVASDIRGHINKLSMAAEVAFEQEPPLRTGEYCDHCSARAHCPALNKASGRIAQYAGVGIPEQLSPEALARHAIMLDAQAAVLEARRSGVRQQIETLIKSGTAVPQWMLESAPGREKWIVQPEVVEQMGRLEGVDVTKPKVLTPRQARLAGLSDATVAALSGREGTALKLVRDDGSKARRVFGR